MYYNQGNDFEYNECMGRGMCSINPSVASFQEIMLIMLRSMTYYVRKLVKLGYDCSELKFNIIDSISNLITTTSYTDEQLLNLTSCHYNDVIKLKREYQKLCKSKQINCNDLKMPLKLTPDMVLSDIINQGQRIIEKKSKQMDKSQKCYAELLLLLIKSVSLSILKLSDLDKNNYDAIDLVLDALNLFNHSTLPVKRLNNMISKLAGMDLSLWKERKNLQLEKFGNITKTEVSLSTRPGKAILVSGSNLMDLYNLLEGLKNENIDIYTHGDLLIAHAFENFKKFKNLKGHFGTSNDNCVLDFATFPGAILLTKHATQNIEYLIRGRLFTCDDIAPKGVIKLHNRDYSELLEAANKAKGFSKGRKKENITVGFNIDELSQKLDEVKEKYKKGDIKHIFAIGMSNYSAAQAEYFNLLLKKLPQKSFIISFSYHCDCENMLFINIANNFPMQLMILDLLFERIPVDSGQITFFLTKCDANTLSSMISLKEMGAKNLYLSDCPPTIINPTIMNSFMQLYSVNEMNNPQKDLENITKKSPQ